MVKTKSVFCSIMAGFYNLLKCVLFQRLRLKKKIVYQWPYSTKITSYINVKLYCSKYIVLYIHIYKVFSARPYKFNKPIFVKEKVTKEATSTIFRFSIVPAKLSKFHRIRILAQNTRTNTLLSSGHTRHVSNDYAVLV